MLRHLLSRIAFVFLVLGSLLVAAPPAANANTGVKLSKAALKAQAAFAAKIKSHLAFMRGPTGLGAAYDTYAGTLAEISAGLASKSITPEDAAFAFANAWGAFIDDTDDVVETVIDTATGNVNDLFGADSSLNAADSALGLLPGQGGPWDAFEAAVQKELDKFRAKALAKLKAMQKAATKAGKGCVNVVVEGPVAAGASTLAPNPGGAAVAHAPGTPKPKSFKMDTEASGSTIGSPSSGVICVSGQADPGNNNKVTVTIFDKSGNAVGAPQTVNVSSKCRWRACFPPSAPYTLPSGDYRIEATQTTGGSSTAKDFSVPNTN